MTRADSAPRAKDLIAALAALADPETAKNLQWFFKTGPGEYGAGDKFIGLKMPVLRAAARPFRELPLDEIELLLASEIHEHRMAGLVICAERGKRAFKRRDAERLGELYDFYLAHTGRINNWDLVDVSCRDVVGAYLVLTGAPGELKPLARSSVLWERRIAIVSTSAFIRESRLEPTFEISELLLGDAEDLIHKATGWMLREAGKKDEAALERFLAEHAATMPRTALRYSIERMTPERRRHWLGFTG